jgi:outer membrane protein assembly factor BamB
VIRRAALASLVAAGLAAGCGSSHDGLQVVGTSNPTPASSQPQPVSSPTSPAVPPRACDPKAGCLAHQIRIGTGGAIAYDSGTLWVAAQPSAGLFGTLLAFDTQTGRRVGSPQPLPASGKPYRLAVAGGAVWVAGATHLWLIDPRTGAPEATVNVPGIVTGLVIAQGALWAVADADRGGWLLKVDPATGAVLKRRQTDSVPSAITVAGGSVWLADAAHQIVVKLSAKNLQEQAKRALPRRSDRWTPAQLTVTDGLLWVFDRGAVLGLSARTGALLYTQQIVAAAGGGDMAAGPGVLWVASMRERTGRGTVIRLDPRTGNQVGHPIELGGRLTALATGGGALWALDSAHGTLFEVKPHGG